MNGDVKNVNIEFGFVLKQNGERRHLNSLTKESLYQMNCFRIFDNYDGSRIGMARFSQGLYENGWKVTNITINPNESIYQLYSSRYNTILNLKVSTDLIFKRDNAREYQSLLDTLQLMSKDARIQNNKIIKLNRPISFNNKYNNDVQIKNLKVLPKAKKLLSKKSKIVLVTLSAVATAVFVGVVISQAIDRSAEIQPNYNQKNYQQQYIESPVLGVSEEVYNKSIRNAKERQSQNGIENNLNQAYDTSIISNQKQTYYHEGNVYYQSPVPNVSDEVYNQSIQAAQQRQIR